MKEDNKLKDFFIDRLKFERYRLDIVISMPKKGKQKAKQTVETEEDELAFLEAAAAANQAAKAEQAAKQEQKQDQNGSSQMELPNLPPKPSDDHPDRKFTPGEYLEYKDEAIGHRSTNAELKQIEIQEFEETILPDLREGAEVHRRVRHWAMENIIKPGVNLHEMCGAIEEATRRLTGYQPIVRGLAFPCGCSINNEAAHYTPTHNDGRVLGQSDIMKVDFGVNINGHIIDSAFSVCFDDRFKPLLDCTREATNTGIRESGIDARLAEIGEAIQEVFDAGTIEINGKIHQIKPITNLSGHLMRPYTIHAGKSIPICKGGTPGKMEQGELYACETFGSTGKGRVHDDTTLSHYMVSPNPPTPRTPQGRKLLKFLQDNFTTLAFCPRMIEHAGEKKYQIPLRQLCECGAVVPYPTLSDVAGSYVAQFEHSFILLPTHKEVLSRGDDY